MVFNKLIKSDLNLCQRNSISTKLKSFKKLDYLLAFLLLQIGWFSVLLNIPRLELAIVPIVLFMLYLRTTGTIINAKIILIFIIYTILAYVQGIFWGFSIVSLVTSFSYTFFLSYCLFRIYKSDLFILLEKVIRVLTSIALSIWLLQQFVPGAKELITNLIIMMNKYNMTDITRNMIFYTYWPFVGQAFGLSRNAGFCNEPAEFSVFIILGIIINYVRNIQLFDKRNLVYYAALLSTFSTTGYLSFITLGLLVLKQRKYKKIGILLFPVIIYSASYAYKNLEFMQPKIKSQYLVAMEQKLNLPTSGRFYGARKSIVVLSKYPFWGRGLLAMTNPEIDDPEFAGYGWLSQIAKFGVLFGSIFLLYFLKGIYRFFKAGGYGIYEFAVGTLSIMILLSSIALISTSYFMIFFFMGFYNYRKVNKYYVVTNKKSLLMQNRLKTKSL